MKEKICVYVEPSIYYEVVFYIQDKNNSVSFDILRLFDDYEKTVFEKMRADSEFSHTEFIVHSKGKEFKEVLSFIKSMSISEYAYYCGNERNPKEHYDNIDMNNWNQLRSTAIMIMEKVYLELVKLTNDDEYKYVIEEVINKLQLKSPLSVSQEYLGKKYRRISKYKEYYFIPVLYNSKLMRLFSNQELWTIIPLMKYEESLSTEKLSKIMKIIGDNTRIKIIQILSSETLYGKEIADRLGVTTPTVTHHINQLLDVGLLHVEKVAQIKYFTLNHKKYDSLLQAMTKIKSAHL